MTERTGLLRATYILAAAVVGLVLLTDALATLQAQVVGQSPADLVVDYRSARAFKDGYNPFSAEGARRAHLAEIGPSGTGHPPTTSFWALPLADRDLRTANAVVCWLGVCLLLLELVMVASALRWPLPHATAWLSFALVVSSSFFTYHVRLGQMSQVIAFLYAVIWLSLRRDDDVVAGVSLGAALTMKLFPGLLLVLLVLAKRWRALAATAVTYLLVAVVMTSRFGLHAWLDFFAQQRLVADEWMSNISNLSLHGIVARLFWPACGVAGPVLGVATLLSTLLSLGLLGLAIRWCKRAPLGADALDLPFALFSVLSVLISQWAWEHYFVLFVVPAAIVVQALVAAARAGASRVGIGAGALALVIAGVCCRIPVVEKLRHQHAYYQGVAGAHWRLHAYEVLNWLPGVLLLLVLLALARTRAGRAT